MSKIVNVACHYSRSFIFGVKYLLFFGKKINFVDWIEKKFSFWLWTSFIYLLIANFDNQKKLASCSEKYVYSPFLL